MHIHVYMEWMRAVFRVDMASGWSKNFKTRNYPTDRLAVTGHTSDIPPVSTPKLYRRNVSQSVSQSVMVRNLFTTTYIFPLSTRIMMIQ